MDEKQILSIVATNADKLVDLEIGNAQLIFVQDKHKIALDFKGNRKFYNDIEVINTDSERLNQTPENGRFYFVIGTAVLWFYQDKWIKLTSTPESYLFVGTELPELGSENQLYVNKNNRNISVWDDVLKGYIPVGETTQAMSDDDIDQLFQ